MQYVWKYNVREIVLSSEALLDVTLQEPMSVEYESRLEVFPSSILKTVNNPRSH